MKTATGRGQSPLVAAGYSNHNRTETGHHGNTETDPPASTGSGLRRGRRRTGPDGRTERDGGHSPLVERPPADRQGRCREALGGELHARPDREPGRAPVRVRGRGGVP